MLILSWIKLFSLNSLFDDLTPFVTLRQAIACLSQKHIKDYSLRQADTERDDSVWFFNFELARMATLLKNLVAEGELSLLFLAVRVRFELLRRLECP